MDHNLQFSPNMLPQRAPRTLYIAPSGHIAWAYVLWFVCIVFVGGGSFLVGPAVFFSLLLEFWVLTALFFLGALYTTALAVVSRVAKLEGDVLVVEPTLPSPLNRIGQKRHACRQISHISVRVEQGRHGPHHYIQLHKIDGTRHMLFMCKDEQHMRVSHDHLNAYLEHVPRRCSLPSSSAPALTHIQLTTQPHAHTLSVCQDNETLRQLTVAGSLMLAILSVLAAVLCIITSDLESLLEFLTILTPLVVSFLWVIPYGYKGMHRTILTFSGQRVEVARHSVLGSITSIHQSDISALTLTRGDTIDLVKQDGEPLVSLSSAMTLDELELLERYLTHGVRDTKDVLEIGEDDATIASVKSLPAHVLDAPSAALVSHATMTPASMIDTPPQLQGTSLLRRLAQTANMVRFADRAALDAALQRAFMQPHHTATLGEFCFLSVLAPMSGEAITLSSNPQTPHTLILTRSQDNLCHHITLFDSGYMVVSEPRGTRHKDPAHHRDASFHVHVAEPHDLGTEHEAQVHHLTQTRAMRPIPLNDLARLERALNRYAYCKPTQEVMFDLALASGAIMLSGAIAYIVGSMM